MTMLECGETVNGYKVLRALSSGAEGCAFEAKCQKTNDSVFLKQFTRVRPSSENGRTFKRIQDELLARLANLTSHYVRRVQEVFVHDNSYCQIADWIDGVTLADAINAMDGVHRRLHATQLATAVRQVHEAGIAHLCLSPSDVFIECRPIAPGNRVIRVIDFDAAHLDGMENLDVVGKPGYASPEHFPGFRHKLGPPSQASDVFALGILLYQLLGGTYPFDFPPGLGFVDQLRWQKDFLKDAGLRPLTDLDGSIATDVADVVNRCMSLWPKERPIAAEVEDVLQSNMNLKT